VNTGAIIGTLIETCKLNGLEPHTYVSDVISKITMAYGVMLLRLSALAGPISTNL
jgi:IS66 C-terminal element